MATKMGHRDSINDMKSAFRDGATQLRESLGKQTDQQLALYESLTVEDFALMSEAVGMDAVQEWIRRMESKRLGVS